MTTRRRFFGGLGALIFGAGCARPMGIFTFDDGITQQDPVGGTWLPGDPWEARTTTTIADSRDTSLEDHVNADYQRFTMPITITQNVVRASTGALSYTRAARVHVEIQLQVTAAGAAGNEIFMTPTGALPDPLTGSIGTGVCGTWAYFGVAGFASGACFWTGTDIHLVTGGVRTGYFGFDPSFALANGDLFLVNFSYIPAPQV